MKKKLFLTGMFSLALALVLGLVSCGGNDDSGSADDPQVITYTSTAGGKTYTLKITENKDRGAYTPQAGDTYELTVNPGNKKSSGTVTPASGGVLTLKPSNSETTFSVTVSSGGITAMSGTITFDGDAGTDTAPATLTPKDNGDGSDLPAITEETTGQPSITVTNAELTGEDASGITIAEQTDNGVTWSVNAGKLNAVFGTPSSTQAISDWLSAGDAKGLFFSVASEDAVTVSNNNARIAYVEYLNSEQHVIGRMVSDTDEETYYNTSSIWYLYVSEDVTLSRAEKSFDEETSNYNFAAFSFTLKTGWNLVQIDSETTITSTVGNTADVLKIADKNVPWNYFREIN